MKPSNSNPLLRALANQARSGDHPDSDLLTAFSEGSLLARERESVMAHLAGCTECREVLSLSAVPQEEAHEFDLVAAATATQMAAAAGPASVTASAPQSAATTQRHEQSRMHMWPAWAAAAAGVAIVSVVALRYAYNKPQQMASAPESKTAPASVTPAVSGPAPATTPAPEPRSQRPRVPEKKATAPRVPATAETAPRFAVSQNTGMANRQSTAVDQAATESAVINADSISSQNALQKPREIAPQESTEMASHGQVLTPAPAASPMSIGGPRGLAPAMAGSLAKSASARILMRPHWHVNADGHVERAFGDGPWQPVLTNESSPMHVVAVAGADVWIGGENEVLYRSRDDGATWERVALSQKGGAGHAIAHIRFANTMSGTIEADDGTTWTTSDGGTTWAQNPLRRGSDSPN